MFCKLPRKWIFLMALAMVMLVYASGMLLSGMTYEGNDDVTIEVGLSHFTFDGLWWSYPWVSILLLYPLGILSYYVPQLPWWYLTCHAFVAGSMLATHYFGLRLAQIKKMPLWLVGLLFAILDSVYCFFAIAEITFSVVPAVMGGAMIAMVLFCPYASSLQRKWITAAVLLGTVYAVAFRWEPGTLTAAFVLLAIAWTNARMHGLFRRKMLLRTLAAVCAVGVISVGIHVFNTYVNRIAQGENWETDNAARTAYMDSPHDGYGENPALYEAAGWSKDTFEFANRWIFLSDEITAESFQYLADHSKANPGNQTVLQNILRSVEIIAHNRKIFLWVAMMLLLWGMSGCMAAVKKDALACLALGLDYLAFLAVFVFLSVTSGRIIYRSVFAIVYPTTVIALFLLVECYCVPDSRKLTRGMTAGLLAVVAIWLTGLYMYAPIQLYMSRYFRFFAYEQQYVEKYEYDHPDQTFFRHAYESVTYNKIPARPHFNSATMGGCAIWHSEYMRQFQKENDIETLNWTVFELPHVYYLGRMDEYTGDVLDYLQREHGCKGLAVLEPVHEGVGVYCMKFVYDHNEADFDSYYNMVVDGEYIEAAK